MKSKKLLNFWIFITVISIFCISVFNYYVDSLNIFGRNNNINLATQKLAEGNIIAGLQNFDERAFRQHTILNLKKEPDFVAIGSSRIMQLRTKMIADNIIFHNYGVSGASLEDYLGLIQIHYDKFKNYPKNIIIGIDPWIFNKNNGQNRYKSFGDYYLKFKNKLLNTKEKTTKISNNIFKLLSIEYTLTNISSLKKEKFYIVKDTNIDDYLRESDGSLHYPFEYRYPDTNRVKRDAIAYAINNQVYSLEMFKYLSNTKIFEDFIKHLILNGTKIYFFLPPYNPYTYDLLIQNPKYTIINDIEIYLKNFAKQNNIQVLGSYNPHTYMLKNEDFFDGMHGLDIVCAKIFKDIKL